MRCSPVLLVVLQFFAGSSGSLGYDPADYLEVYPDPTDPEVLRGRTPLHFALIQSLGGQYDGSGAVAGVKVALDSINNNSSILPGYTLHYTFADSQCFRTEGLKAYFSQVLREPTKLAVIGSGCSLVTEPTAEISYFYNISHISCLSSSTLLRNRLRFPSYFQLLTTEDTMAFGYYSVIKEYRWRRVAFIVQDENVFTVTVDRLKELLDGDDGEVEYSSRVFDSNSGITDLGDDIFDEDSRIFLLVMYVRNARSTLCEAYNMNIRPPRYTFLTVAWYNDGWWTMDSEGLSCTTEQRESILVSSLAVLNTGFLDEVANVNLMTDTGLTSGEYLAAEKLFIGQPPLNLTDLNIRYSQYCYDATWTLAYALSETMNSISDTHLNAELSRAFNITPPFKLEDFTYSSNRLLDVIFGHLKNTSFHGVTKQVYFDDQGIRPLIELEVFQYRNRNDSSDLELENIGIVIPVGEEYAFEYVQGEDVNTVWNGLIPYDGVPVKVVVTFHLFVTIIFVSLACAGIVFAGVCLVFNFAYRKSKLIKLASSQLNYLIGIGAIILYVDSVLFVIPSTDPDVVTVLCNITPWLTAIGYSLCYGTILTKMARVYYIFNNPSANKKGIQDWMLIVGVGLLVAIDLMILITYMVVEGIGGNLGSTLVPFRENEMDKQGVRVHG